MNKWFRVKQPFGTYSRGDLICPQGLHREQLQAYNRIERHPCYIGAQKPTQAQIDEYALKIAPKTAVLPEPVAVVPPPVDSPAPEPEPVADPEPVVAAPQLRRGKGRI